MRPFELVDLLYEDFVASLNGPLADAARGLAVTLRLAPERGIPWSGIFSHEVTLAAPALIAEGFPGLPGSCVEAAVSAHMLAVLEAFGTDRIADRQVSGSNELLALLEAMRIARNQALSCVTATAEEQVVSFEHADRTTRAAIAEEGAILRSGHEVVFDEYERVSFGKQAVGFPASFALAFGARAATPRLRTLSGLLGGVWLGLQMADDVVDREDDAARGGAGLLRLAGATWRSKGLPFAARCSGRGSSPRCWRGHVVISGPRSAERGRSAPIASRSGRARAKRTSRGSSTPSAPRRATWGEASRSEHGRRRCFRDVARIAASALGVSYELLPTRVIEGPGGDLVVATSGPLGDEEKARLASERRAGTGLDYETLVAREPLFWTCPRLRRP